MFCKSGLNSDHLSSLSQNQKVSGQSDELRRQKLHSKTMISTKASGAKKDTVMGSVSSTMLTAQFMRATSNSRSVMARAG